MNCSTCFGAASGRNSKRNVPRSVLTIASSSEGGAGCCAKAAVLARNRSREAGTARIAFIFISACLAIANQEKGQQKPCAEKSQPTDRRYGAPRLHAGQGQCIETA